MSNHPNWISSKTAGSISVLAGCLEKNGPQKVKSILDALPEFSISRVTRLLSILENWNLAEHDRTRKTWGLSGENWKEEVDRRVIPESPFTGQKRERELARTRTRIIRTLAESGEVSREDLGKVLGIDAVDYYADFLIRKGMVVRSSHGSTVRYYLPTASQIDSITAAMAACGI